MKKMRMAFVAAISMSVFFVSCQKDAKTSTPEISKDELSKIASMGFSTEGVVIKNGGYLVEGDIFIPASDLGKISKSTNLIVANEEQYRTTNLVTGLPRIITVSVTNLPQVYADATDECIARYNALGLGLTFQRVASGGSIDIFGFNEGPSGGYITLGSAGFPTASGDPYSQVKLNTNSAAYGTNPDMLYVASVIQHEIGHCIGMRHTDYMNRAYSCGGRRANEGSAGVGAIHIPGTPTKADPNSWMLACSNGGNRTFNANDIIALNYLY